MTKGRSIRLFLADGTPGGIITAEIMNWTGHVMVGPRSRLPDLIQRPEAGRTGIYVLTGTDPEGGIKPLVYVGETDNVGKRLAQHNKDDAKEFWEQTCVVTSKDQNLTKAHVRYLESRLIEIAIKAGRAKLANGTAPEYGLLPEADLADMEFFIDQLRTMLPVLGLDFLKPKVGAMNVSKRLTEEKPLTLEEIRNFDIEDIPVFEMTVEKDGARARAVESNGEFTVLEGSTARKKGTPSWKSYVTVHQSLVENGVLVPTENPNILEFTENTTFNSPSGAACVIAAADRNGRTAWRLMGTKKTYADWQEEQVAAVPQPGDEE